MSPLRRDLFLDACDEARLFPKPQSAERPWPRAEGRLCSLLSCGPLVWGRSIVCRVRRVHLYVFVPLYIYNITYWSISCVALVSVSASAVSFLHNDAPAAGGISIYC